MTLRTYRTLFFEIIILIETTGVSCARGTAVQIISESSKRNINREKSRRNVVGLNMFGEISTSTQCVIYKHTTKHTGKFGSKEDRV